MDIEDGIKKGRLDWDFLKAELIDKCNSEVLGKVLDQAEKKIGAAPLIGRARDEAMATAFRTYSIASMVVATGELFEKEYDSIMNGKYPHELLYQSSAGSLAKACKRVAVEHVYKSPQVIKREIMGRNVIHDLLDLYWEAAQDATAEGEPKGTKGKIYSQISPNYRHVFAENMRNAYKAGIPEDYFRMQLITDQLSGMTDTFAVTLH